MSFYCFYYCFVFIVSINVSTAVSTAFSCFYYLAFLLTKSNSKLSSIVSLQFYFAFDLIHKGTYQLQAKRAGVFEIDCCRKT
jgi:hypothetical protein